MHNDGENFTLDSLSNEFPSTTIQSATDCSRLGRTLNQFRRLCPQRNFGAGKKDSEPTYSSINSLSTNEGKDALVELHDDGDVSITDDDEDKPKCEKNTHVDHYRLCKAKAAQDAILRKSDASLAEKSLTAAEAP